VDDPALQNEGPAWDDGELRLERRVRTFALPAALGLGFLLSLTGGGRFLLRVFCGMWIHELGHALTAWLSGLPALPGPWATYAAEERSPVFAAVLSAVLLAGAVRSWFDGRPNRAGGLLLVLALQVFLSHVLPVGRAHLWVVWSGDAACLWLGALLMASVYAPEGSWPQRGWLRFGLLCIGAFAFMDVFTQWWAARRDFERIPFGRNEGAGLSDPSRLQDTWGWSTDQIVGRYVLLGAVCLAALLALYAWGLYTALQRERGAR
jgi:hypothetical protein